MNPEQADAEEVQKQEQEKIDTAEPLSEEQIEEREKLLQEVSVLCFIFTMRLSRACNAIV